MRIIRISLLLFWSSCAALIAQPSEQLYQLLHLDELVEIVSEEGLADANATADAYLQGVTRGGFGASIAKIYDKNSLSSRVKAMFAKALPARSADRLIGFYNSDLGLQVSQLEVSARRAITDPSIEDYVIELVLEAEAQGKLRPQLLRSAIKEMDWVKQNLAGAFEARFAFLEALSQVEALQLDRGQIFTLMQSDQEALSKEIEEWLLGYMHMAYSPLSDDELTAYLAFQTSPEGMDLNAALFDTFNKLTTENAQQLGQFTASALSAQDL